MDLASTWQNVFTSWPGEIPHHGILISATADTIPFVEFIVADGFVILERDRPDAMGARKVIMALEAIQSIKFTTPDALETLRGFAQSNRRHVR